MKILVLGGTGAIGKDLVKILSNDNEVIVTSRNKKESYNNVKFIQGNAKDNIFLQELLKDNYDVIVDFMNYATEEFSLRYNLFLDNTDQYIFLSSSRVYADSIIPITEDSFRLLDICKDEEYLKTDEYALAKARQENFLLDCDKKNWTIIRPYITYNDNRLQLGIFEKELWLYRALKGRSIIFSSDVAGRMTTMTYGYDVAASLFYVIGKSSAKGEIVNIMQPKPVKWSEVLDIYIETFKIIGLGQPNIVMLDSSLEYGDIIRRPYQLKYDRLYDRIFDNRKLLSFLPESYAFTNVYDGLKNCLKNFYEEGSLFGPINWRFEAYADKVSAETTPYREIPTIKERLKYYLYKYSGFKGFR